MPVPRGTTLILLFDRKPIIPPSRSPFPAPSRAVVVKTGRKAGVLARLGLDHREHGGACWCAAGRRNWDRRRAGQWIS